MRRVLDVKGRALGPACAGALVLAGVGLPAPAAASTIHACVVRTTGVTRIVSAKARCRRGESKLSWTTSGARGAAGPEGKPGPEGKAGPAGAVAGYAASNSTSVVLKPGSAEATLIVSKTLPPGSYLLFGKSLLAATALTEGTALAACQLTDNAGTAYHQEKEPDQLDLSAMVQPLAKLSVTDFLAESTVSLEAPLSSTVTSVVALTCFSPVAGGPETLAADSQLLAVQTSQNS